MPKVSIIIPVYNCEKYLKECLDSVLSQTLQDFELICINDGSTDDSFKILQEYAQKDSRFIIIDKCNEGQGVARNLGIKKATGEYLICLDSDDWLEKEALELAYNKIKEDNSDILFFDAYRFVMKYNKKYVLKYTEIYKNFKENPFSPQDAGKILFLTNGLTFKMYNLDFIKRNNVRFSECKFIEDATFYIKAMLTAEKIICLSKPLYNYRIQNKSSTTDYKEYFKCVPKVYDECFEIIKEHQISDDILKSFIENRKGALLYFYSMTPFIYKYRYYKMMQKIIKTHFAKYELSPELSMILSTNFLVYELKTHIEKTIYVLKAYTI